MKEFSHAVQDILKRGLRPYHKRTVPFQLYDLFNFKPTDFGMVPYEVVEFPISAATLATYSLDEEVFPFPQIIQGKKYTFVCGATSIFTVDSDDWTTLTALTTYDADDPDTAADITTGGVWRLADFWDTWFLTNGVCTVFACGKDWVNIATQKIFVSAITPIQAAIAYKGRLIFGGFDHENFWSDTAESFLGDWYNKNYDTGLNPYVEIDGTEYIAPIWENFIWWSSIGGGDATLLLFPSNVLESGFLPSSYSSAKPFIFDLLKRNEQGFAPMPVQGQVTDFAMAGDYVIVFSENGVTAIKGVVGPSPTFSIIPLNAGGINNRGAVVSDGNNVLYVDKSGMLIFISSELKIDAIGYREFIFNMIDNIIILSHSSNPQNNDNFGEYTICDGTYTFILNASGMFQVGHDITSTIYIDGATVGMGDELEGAANIIGRIGVDGNDFGLPGLKTLEWVRVENEETSEEDSPIPSLQVSADYLYKGVGDGDWESTGYTTINDEGIAYFPITGTRFRINIRVAEYDKHNPKYFEVGIKHGDKRYTRHLAIGEAVSIGDK